MLTGASGVRLTVDVDGEERELVDAMASWWAVIHGYGHPTLVAAATAQLRQLSHVMFGGLVHEPALCLARRLTALVPVGLSRVFFSDSGSVAVEVALKMALQYWQNVGTLGKDKFVCFTDGYHGDTFGAMSVSDPAKSMHKALRGALARSQAWIAGTTLAAPKRTPGAVVTVPAVSTVGAL